MLTVTPNMDLAASITDRIDRERFETKTETWITRDLDPNLPAPFWHILYYCSCSCMRDCLPVDVLVVVVGVLVLVNVCVCLCVCADLGVCGFILFFFVCLSECVYCCCCCCCVSCECVCVWSNLYPTSISVQPVSTECVYFCVGVLMLFFPRMFVWTCVLLLLLKISVNSVNLPKFSLTR